MTREEKSDELLRKAKDIQEKLSQFKIAEALEILNLTEALVRASGLFDIQSNDTRTKSESNLNEVSNKQEYLDKKSLFEYLGITSSQYYSQRLWEKIPNTKFGRTRIFKCELVDWYMTQNSGEDIKDTLIHSRYLNYVKGHK